MNCQNCGTKNENNANFCASCGSKLNNINQIDSNDNSKKNNTLIIVLIIVFVIIFSLAFMIKSFMTKMIKKNLPNINDIPSIIEKIEDIRIPEVLKCEGDNCHEMKIYILKDIGNNKFDEVYETYSVEDGTILETKTLVDYINRLYGKEIITSDGETFTITMGGYSVDICWYYKDTDEKFNFNEPITKDIEIEMKLFNGSINNDLLKNIQGMFGTNE